MHDAGVNMLGGNTFYKRNATGKKARRIHSEDTLTWDDRGNLFVFDDADRLALLRAITDAIGCPYRFVLSGDGARWASGKIQGGVTDAPR